jgi:hypothetical protein
MYTYAHARIIQQWTHAHTHTHISSCTHTHTSSFLHVCIFMQAYTHAWTATFYLYRCSACFASLMSFSSSDCCELNCALIMCSWINVCKYVREIHIYIYIYIYILLDVYHNFLHAMVVSPTMPQIIHACVHVCMYVYKHNCITAHATCVSAFWGVHLQP